MLLQEAIDEFIMDCRCGGLSKRTVEAYRYHLLPFQAAVAEPVADVQPRHVRLFLFALQERNLSPFTVDQAYRTLNTFFRWLVREDLRTDNPVTKVRRPRLPKILIPRLNVEQVRQLLTAVRSSALPQRNMAMVLLMLDSGLRVGEVVGLKVEDLSLDAGHVLVTGKGNKEREVPVGETTEETLRLYVAARATGPVFVTGNGQPITVHAVQMMVKRAGRRAGIARLYPHLLRHTFAKFYLEEGDLKTLQVILGYASVETTAAIYVDPDINDLKRRHRRAAPIDRLFRT